MKKALYLRIFGSWINLSEIVTANPKTSVFKIRAKFRGNWKHFTIASLPFYDVH